MEKDLSFFLLSTLVFFLSLCKTVLLFLQIVRKSYIMIEGTCLGIHPMLFCNCNEIILEDMDGNSLRLMLGKIRSFTEECIIRSILRLLPVSHPERIR